MRLSDNEIKIFEESHINRISKLFTSKSKLHHKWYGVKEDNLVQFGTVNHLFGSDPEQIIFETYNHEKPAQVEILFFNNDLVETKFIELSNGWKIGRRISDKSSDKKYEIINPDGEINIIEFGSNLYSKVFKSILKKIYSKGI